MIRVLVFASMLTAFLIPRIAVNSEEINFCDDSCDYANDTSCDDGGPGADYPDSYCSFGSDCSDCGARILNASEPLCMDTCYDQTRDGVCDDSGPGADTEVCFYGTDCTDCGPRYLTGSEELCTDNCTWSNDSVCDDGGLGSPEGGCAYGTDCTDCGPRYYDEYMGPTVVLPVPTKEPIDFGCTDICSYSNDNFCDDGVDATGPEEASYCQVGTDCSDCGRREFDFSVPLCMDTCFDKNNGVCDDSGPGSGTLECFYGSDCNDCGPRWLTGPIVLCDDSCTFAGDDVCDDTGLGSFGKGCQYGTDCSDCGTRYFEIYPTVEAKTTANNTMDSESSSVDVEKLVIAILVLLLICLVLMVVGFIVSQVFNYKLLKTLTQGNHEENASTARNRTNNADHKPRTPTTNSFTTNEMTPVEIF